MIKRQQFGFHLTATKNLPSIWQNGLLPSQGGVNPKGLCNHLADLSCPIEVQSEADDYKERSRGYLFFAKDLATIKIFKSLSDRVREPYTILGIRLDGLGAHGYETDPDYGGRGAFRTKQNIPPSRLVDLGHDIKGITKEYLPKKSFFPCFGP